MIRNATHCFLSVTFFSYVSYMKYGWFEFSLRWIIQACSLICPPLWDIQIVSWVGANSFLSISYEFNVILPWHALASDPSSNPEGQRHWYPPIRSRHVWLHPPLFMTHSFKSANYDTIYDLKTINKYQT